MKSFEEKLPFHKEHLAFLLLMMIMLVFSRLIRAFNMSII